MAIIKPKITDATLQVEILALMKSFAENAKHLNEEERELFKKIITNFALKKWVAEDRLPIAEKVLKDYLLEKETNK